MKKLIYLFLALLIVACGDDDSSGGNSQTALLNVSYENQEVNLNTTLGMFDTECWDLNTGEIIANVPRLEGFDEENFDGGIDLIFNIEAYPLTTGTYSVTDFCPSNSDELNLVYSELVLYEDFFEQNGLYRIVAGTLNISSITDNNITFSFEGMFDFYNFNDDYLGTVNCTFNANETNYENFYN
jgi:hypothetical protein